MIAIVCGGRDYMDRDHVYIRCMGCGDDSLDVDTMSCECGYPDKQREAELAALRAHRDQLTDDLGSLEDRMEIERRESAALRARVAAAEADAARYRFLRGRVEDYDGFACFESIPYPAPIPDRAPFNSIDDAVDTAMRAAADRASASAPDVHTPKPVCKHCGQFLDARGKCRVSEHNSMEAAREAFRISADAHEADNYIAADVPAQDDPGNA